MAKNLDLKFGVANRLLVQLEEVKTDNGQEPGSGTSHVTNLDFANELNYSKTRNICQTNNFHLRRLITCLNSKTKNKTVVQNVETLIARI